MENPILKLSGGEAGSIQLRLNSKGLYTWTIQLGIKDGATPLLISNQLDAINSQLELTFPNHARKSTGKMRGFK